MKKPRALGSEAFFNCGTCLNVKGRTAAAGAFDVRIFELKSGAFEGLDVVDDAAVQVHHGSGVHVDFQSVHVENLVHHACTVFEGHGVGEAGASTAHDAHAQ